MARTFGRFGKGRGFGKPDLPIEVMARKSGASSGKGAFGLDVRITQDEMLVSIGALSLVDYVSRALLAHHASSIAEGRRPAGGMQAQLDPDGAQGKRARAGKRPNVRGNTGKPSSIPPKFTRGEIKGGTRPVNLGSIDGNVRIGPRRAPVIGVSASADLYPGRAGQQRFMDDEASEGIEYLAVDGAADRVIEDVVIDYLAKVFDGTRYYNPEKTRAEEL